MTDDLLGEASDPTTPGERLRELWLEASLVPWALVRRLAELFSLSWPAK